ncbi:MAG TPA: hypothetical protein VFV50_16635 [Bdellovibrionales bacterium]|nr:hypothetical protein [Bdellovibrionales bacterium]
MKKRTWTMVLAACILSASFSHAQAKKTSKPPQKLPGKKGTVASELTDPSHAAPAAPRLKGRRPPLDPNKSVRIEYTNMKWNIDSTKPDTAAVVLRDAQTGRTVQVQLYETAPDSGQFRGYYNITWGAADELLPEIYVPTEPIRDEADAVAIQKQLELRKMRRLPFILRKGEKQEQLVEVFNSRQEAQTALDAYKAAAEAKLPPKDNVAAKALLETAELAKIEAQKKKEAEEAMAREAERRRLEEAERQRADELRRQQEAITAAERERRKKLAQQQASTAMDLFRAGQFEPAEAAFKKAHELDPNDTSFYFGYGVTLYRNKKYNDSLVILRLAADDSVNAAERDFFIGLNHLALKEYSQALSTFQRVKAAKHPQISPSAAFYEGVVHFNELRYEPAKDSFQEVLDTSQDPKMDQAAEDYIEKIEGILYFIRNKEKQFFITASIGAQYDSNVLLVNTSDPSTGTATDVADTRTVFGAGFEYRPVYTKETEFSAKIKTDMIFSQKSTNVLADPFLVALKLPYKHKGMLWGKGYRMELTPGYEILKLDVDQSGASKSMFAALGDKENYLNSITLDWVNTRIMTDDWYTSYNLKLRSDAVGNEAGSSAAGDNDPSAFQATFTWNNMWFMNKKKTTAWVTDLGLTQNSAKGKNLAYTKLSGSASYMMPWVWDMTAMGNLTLYHSQYPQRDPSARQDTNAAATVMVLKPVTDWLKTSLSVNYTLNESNVSSSKYNKLLGMLLFSGEWQF